MRNDHCSFLPRNVGIELVRGCHFKCRMCPVTSNSIRETEILKYIDLDLLRSIIDELDRWPSIKTIWYFHFGEPLAHPDYRKCLEILAQSSVAQEAMVIQFTNASLLQGDKAEALLDIPIIKKLVFSFDGFGDRESFERLRGPHYDQVLKNIRTFSERAKKVRPDLILATCTILPREGEVPGLRVPDTGEALDRLHRLFDPIDVHVEIRDMHDYSGNDPLELRGIAPEKIFGGCTFVEQDSLYLTVNGWVQPCCAVYHETFNLGRFPDQGFGHLLNNNFMRYLRNHLRLDKRDKLPFCRNCRLSVGGYRTSEEFDCFWKERDDQGLVQDLEERRQIYGVLVSKKHPVVKLDLGCGTQKYGGFIGVDRFALPGVDIIADLNHFLPFRDDSADLILCSHSLEHVENLHETMKEIYRICRHGTQVCIIAPYGQQSLNLANPFHKQIFNEDTPRFWTNCPQTLIDSKEFYHPHTGGSWGLASSDHSPAEMDFRCFRMEFFYFPEYRYLPEEEQRSARKKYLNVCDQIMYHLVAVKEPNSEDDMAEIEKQMDYYEPPYITIRRLQERSEFLENEFKKAQSELRSRETELLDLRNRLEEKETRLSDALNEIQARETELAQWKARSVEEVKRYEEIRAELEFYKTKMSQMETLRDTQETELRQLRTLLYQREAELGEAKKESVFYRDKYFEVQGIQKDLESEVAQLKQRLSAEINRFEEAQREAALYKVKLGEVQVLKTSQETELRQLRTLLYQRETELGETKEKVENYNERLTEVLDSKKRLENEVSQLKEMLDQEARRFEGVRVEKESYKAKWVEAHTQHKRLEDEILQLKELLNIRERDILEIQSSLKNREAEIEGIQAVLATREADLVETRRALEEKENDLNRFKNKGKVISSELDLFRHRKVTRLVDRFFNKSDLLNDLLPTFLQLKDDSYLFTRNLKGYRLLPSKNLQKVPFLYYPLELGRKNLRGILLAPILDFPTKNGFLGIEIVSPDDRLVAQSMISTSQIDESLPTRFDFPPIPDTDRGRFWIRVFASQTDYPIRVFEWKKYSFWRLGPPQTRAFCGFLFGNDE